MKPIREYLLVKPEVKNMSNSVIILEESLEKSNFGEVIAAGPGTKDVKMVVKTGDKVFWPPKCGTEIEVNGVPHLMIKHQDIMAILT